MTTEHPPTGGQTVRTFDRALEVLGCFSAEHPERSVSEVAASSGLDRATARRLLRTLESLGYLASSASRYRLTPRVLRLGYATVAAQTFPELVQPYLDEVAHAVDHSCSLAVLDEDAAVFIARAAVRRVMTITLAPGARVPACASAVGRALLTGLEQEELRDYLRHVPQVPYTDRTVTEPEEIARLVAEARGQGWVLLDQELEAGVRSVAVPIHDSGGRVPAAVTVGTHTGLVDSDTLLDTILPRLRACAASIERTITRQPIATILPDSVRLFPRQR